MKLSSAGTRPAHADLGKSPSVLLLVDVVNPLDFEGANALHVPAVAAARALVRFRARATRQGIQCIYANDNYGAWRSDFQAVWRRCSRLRGAPGVIARALKPRSRDLTILKPRHSAFYATPLDLLLKQLECRRVIVTGLSADNCVFFTAMDAYLRGYAVLVPSDCVAAQSSESKEQALAQMARVLKADTRAALAGKTGV